MEVIDADLAWTAIATDGIHRGRRLDPAVSTAQTLVS
jgi:hypothetical protein